MCLQPTTCDQLKTVVLPITWEGKAGAQAQLSESEHMSRRRRGDRACTHMQAHENAFTAVSSLPHRPTGSAGGCRDLASEIACFSLRSGENLSYNFPPLKLLSQEQRSYKNNLTDHSGGYHVLVSKEFFRAKLKGRKLS